MQLRPLRLQFNRPAELADGAVEIPGKIERARQNVMSLGVVRSQAHRLLRFPQCGGRVSLSGERAGEIHVRQREIGLQFHRGLKLNDCGIDLSLREQNPAQRVVSFRAARCKPHNFFQIRARGYQIAPLQRRHAVLIGSIRLRNCIRLRRTRRLRRALWRNSAAEKQQATEDLKE